MRRSLVVLALSAALFAAGCSMDEAAPAGGPAGGMPPPEVGVVTLQPQDVALSRELVGRLSAYRSADVRARVPGVLQRRLYEEGSDVRKGQPLFQIDPAQLRATLAQAQGALAQFYTPSPRATDPGTGLPEMVPLANNVDAQWVVAPPSLTRYNGYASVEVVGSQAPGHSSGEAMDAMERIVEEDLPEGFGYDWTGQSFQEILSGSQAPALMALSILVVFLCLAALYESWSVPVSVLLVVPLGVLGAVVFTLLRGLPNDIYFKIGLITVIGLAAKNAILIVEFAIAERREGKTLRNAVVEAAKLRFRPILMTSFAFIMGVSPLALSSGAGANARHAIGTGVIGGMLFATFLGLLLIPVFYVVVRRLLGDKMDEAPRAGA